MGMSDTLFDMDRLLSDQIESIGKRYDEETLAEARNICRRIDTLRSKLDVEYYGSMRFEDGGIFEGYQQAVHRYKLVRENLIAEGKEHLVGQAHDDLVMAYWKDVKSKED